MAASPHETLLNTVDQRDLRNLTDEQVDQWVRYIASKSAKEARDWQRTAESQCHRAEAQARGKQALSARERRSLANATILDRIGRAAVTLQEDAEIGADVIAMLQYDIRRGVV